METLIETTTDPNNNPEHEAAAETLAEAERARLRAEREAAREAERARVRQIEAHARALADKITGDLDEEMLTAVKEAVEDVIRERENLIEWTAFDRLGAAAGDTVWAEVSGKGERKGVIAWIEDRKAEIAEYSEPDVRRDYVPYYEIRFRGLTKTYSVRPSKVVRLTKTIVR